MGNQAPGSTLLLLGDIDDYVVQLWLFNTTVLKAVLIFDNFVLKL